MKDQKTFHFDPANLVLNICEIYINLCKNDAFTLAVSQDGRSYTPELFNSAGEVLGMSVMVLCLLKSYWSSYLI